MFLNTYDLPDLHAFCSTDPRRAKQLGAPWSEGSYSYACDGRMLLRVPRQEEIPERDDAPGVAHLVVWHPVGAYQPLPPQPEPAFRPCGSCSPKTPEESAAEKCAECDGTGSVPMVVPVGVGPQYISSFYLRRLHELSRVRLANHPSDKNGPLHFHFQGGDGVVMPIKKD